MGEHDINYYINRHDKYLFDYLDGTNIPDARLKKAIKYVVSSGGKRLRPSLVYLCGAIIDIKINALDIMAAAIELTHCYSLVHDDLPAMDNDDFRRGKPSCHKAFDEATAILVGDALQILAIQLLATELPKYVTSEKAIEVIKVLTIASGVNGMISGQSLDLSVLTNQVVTEDQLSKIHHLKTGALFTACIKMVLAAGNPCNKTAALLEEFASSLGLVFQMQDDYLDCYGANDSLGKGRASDAANNKTTFATIYNQSDLGRLINKQYEKASITLKTLDQETLGLENLMELLKIRTSPKLGA